MGKKSTGLTHTEEKKARKKRAEADYVLDTLGQESEKKAVKPVQEYIRNQKKKEKEKKDKELSILNEKRKKPKVAAYIKHLLVFIHDEILKFGMDKSYQWGVWHDGKGVRVSIRDPYKKLHQKAFFLTFNPDYDLFACQKTVWWAEDVYDGTQEKLQEELWTPLKN